MFGAIYPVIFLNGKPSIITGYFGLKRHLLLVSLLWIRFKKIVSQHRLAQKRSVYTSFIILDAQSVKNTDPAESSGYDGGKKVSGIKRHLAVDINGLPMAVHVTTANVSERDGANALLALNKSQFDLVQRVMADGGYTGNNFAQSVQNLVNTKNEPIYGLIFD
ncbi:transposase [Loigolactobacillus coryniformis]|uniref:transposase n=1 Tax=Loigolactobacillus coryniformis TaxID=1610 RepID=UPI00215BAB6F|nr:transposase [Loigolactobacillus coryniformis]